MHVARRLRTPLWPYWAVHLATLAGGGAFVLYEDRKMWFWLDEWEFVDRRGLVGSQLGLWTPHNDHWSTLPILAYRATLNIFGMRSYIPFLVVLVILHLALAHTLWRVSLRLGAAPLIATGLVAVFVVLGSGQQNIGWAFQIGFVGSVLFGWLWLWTADHDLPFGRRDMLGWVAGLASLMCSAIGIPMLMATAISVWIRRGVRQAALVVSLPTVALLIWYALYGHSARRSAPITRNTLFDLGNYAWTGIENAFTSAIGFSGVGAVLVVAILYGFLRRPSTSQPSDAPARAATVCVILAFLFIGIGRSGLGAAQSDRTRYVYVTVALVLPGAAVLLSSLFRRTIGHSLVFVLLTAVVVVVNMNDLRNLETGYAAGADQVKQQILGSYDLANGSSYVFPDAPSAVYGAPGLSPTVANLRQFRRSGWLAPSYPVPPKVLLVDQVRMEIGILGPGAPPPPGTAGAGVLASWSGATLQAGAPGCVTVTPTANHVALGLAPSSNPILLRLSRTVSGKFVGRVSDPVGSVAIGPYHVIGTSSLLVAVTNVSVSLSLPSQGPTVVCGVTYAKS